MAKATILAVDDERSVLNSVERDLRQKYGREFRIAKADSGQQALEFLHELKKRNEALALIVADQRMPQMDGVQFLEQAIQIYPETRRVLLTAYADTEAAISAINKVNLDYFLMKPWDPPEEHLYPVLDSLIEDWLRKVRLPFEGIRVIGNLWSPNSHEVKDFLARNSIPYMWLDILHNPEAHQLLKAAGANEQDIPVLVFPDGSTLTNPSLAELAQKTGLQTKAQNPFYDVVIIGAGPAGLSAAVLASSDGLKVLLVERQAPGGQAGNSPRIENFLGFPSGISGGELARRAVIQARRFGTEILTTQQITKVESEGNTKTVTFEDGSKVNAKIILIATGAWFRTLNLPGIERWHGAGVYYGAAHTEAAYYQDKNVIVVGGANSAAQGLLFLTRYAKKVTVLIRSADPDWSQYLDVAIRDNEKIEILFNTELAEINGDQEIESVEIKNNETGERKTLEANAVFVFIGQKPQSEFVHDVVACTPNGHILTGLDLAQNGYIDKDWPLQRPPLLLETSVPGIFAAGDVRNGTKHGVAAAAGDGGAAVSMFWQYLSTI
jgi:thioredoxin reductase (NADPH)